MTTRADIERAMHDIFGEAEVQVLEATDVHAIVVTVVVRPLRYLRASALVPDAAHWLEENRHVGMSWTIDLSTQFKVPFLGLVAYGRTVVG